MIFVLDAVCKDYGCATGGTYLWLAGILQRLWRNKTHILREENESIWIKSETCATEYMVKATLTLDTRFEEYYW